MIVKEVYLENMSVPIVINYTQGTNNIPIRFKFVDIKLNTSQRVFLYADKVSGNKIYNEAEDEEAEVRHCAFIRGNAIVGKGSVVGNSTELKNVIIFNSVQVPHYNYVGDSILGYKSHMGAGSITSNVKSDKTLVVVKDSYASREEIATGLKKFGAMLGDYVEVGCNSVLNPGTVIGPHSNVYPLSRVRGVIPGNSIFKDPDHVVAKHEQGEILRMIFFSQK